MEGRDQPRENPRGEAGGRTQSRGTLPPNLARVNAAAHRADQTRFTALLHHVDRAALERAFRRQKRQASAGVDGITVEMYEHGLGGQPPGPTRAHPHRALPTTTGAPRLYPESRWRTATTRRAGFGGQDRPECGRRIPEHHLRGRLPRVLLRLPAEAEIHTWLWTRFTRRS